MSDLALANLCCALPLVRTVPEPLSLLLFFSLSEHRFCSLAIGAQTVQASGIGGMARIPPMERS